MQTKRILSLVMALAMLFTLTMPALAWAAEGDEDGNPGDVSSQGDVGTDTVDIGAVGNGENDPADNGSANTGAAGNGESDPADNGSASGAAGNTEGDPADDGIATTGAAGNTEGDPVEGGNPDSGSAAGGDPAAEPTEEPASEEGDGVPPSDPIAAVVGGEAYASFTEALAAALASGAVLELRANAPKEVVLSDGETLLVLAGEFSITVRAAEGCSLSVSDPDAGGVVTYRAAAEAAAPSELPEADPSDDPQPLDDPTPEVSVARVGDEMYATLWEAIDAAPSGATVTLLEAVSETFYVSSNIVLDLNGNSIEANSTVFNYGTLKIIGSGTITGSLSNEGTLTVAGGTMTSVAERTILNKGTLLVSGGTVENRANGVYCAIDNDGGTIRVTGGTVKGCTAIRLSKATEQDGAVDLTVSGGKIQGTDLDIDRADDSAVLSITGGTFAHDPTALLDPAAFCAFPEGDGYAVIPQEVPDDPEISGTCGDSLTWTFDESTDTLTIEGTGAMTWNEDPNSVPWNIYRSLITKVILPSGLTSIYCYAFQDCSRLTSISIPQSVSDISWNAFSGCSALNAVSIPDGVSKIDYSVFDSCTSLTSVTIPEGVTLLCAGAFDCCTGLKSIIIPYSVNTIDAGVFSGCTSLTDVYFRGTEREAGQINFSEDNDLLLNATWHYGNTIGQCGEHLYWSFNEGTGALTITGYGAMYDYCEDYENPWVTASIDRQILTVDLPDGITCLGTYSFYGLDALTTIVIPSTVTTIGEGAFNYCGSLTSVTIPNSVTSIGDMGFSGCERLTDVYYNGTIWQKEQIDVGVDNQLLWDATWHFSTPSGQCGDDLYWTYAWSDDGYGLLTITGSGPMYDFTDGHQPWESVGVIDGISLPDGLTSIGNYAFAGCGEVYDVRLPDSVISIGEYAFSHCDVLARINFPENITSIGKHAFEYCANLGCTEPIVLSEGITSIEDSVFAKCNSMCSITLPNSLTRIGNCSFMECYGLSEIIIPDSVSYIDAWAFYSCNSLTSVSLPNSLTCIRCNSFENCTAMTSVNIPNRVTRIESSAFSNSGITSLIIPDSVVELGGAAFRDCSKLKELTIPITLNASECFDGCTAIEKVRFTRGQGEPANYGLSYPSAPYDRTPWYLSRANDITIELDEDIPGIGSFTFFRCTGIRSITVRRNRGLGSAETRGSGIAIRGYAFSECTALTSIILPETVIEIEGYAFAGCTDLTSVTVPSSVTALGQNAFEGCTSLTSITIPEGVSCIEDDLFSGCNSLMSVTIPNSVSSFGVNAFSNCTAITDVYYDGEYQVIHDPNATHTGSVVYADQEQGIFWDFPALSIAYGNDPLTASSVTWHCRQTCGSNLTWFLDESTGVLIIDGTGDMYDFEAIGRWGEIYPPWYLSCTNIRTVIMPEGLTRIGNYAFVGCSNPFSAPIPSTVTEIGERAFSWCYQMDSVDLPDGLISIGEFAFDGCSRLTEIIIPDTVTSIGNGAFYGCSSVTSLTLGNGVSEIGYTAFQSCDKLTDVYYQGTEEEAEVLKAHVSHGNDYLLNAQWHCLGAVSGWAAVDADDFDPDFWAWLVAQTEEGENGSEPRYAKEENGVRYINLDADRMEIDENTQLTSLRGVNKFVNLEFLTYEGHDGYRLSAVDLAGMTKLKELWLNRNDLTSLDLSGMNPQVFTELYLFGNSIPALALPAGTSLQKLIKEWYNGEEVHPLQQFICDAEYTENDGTWSFDVNSLSRSGAQVDPAKVTVALGGFVTGYDTKTGIVTFNAKPESFTYQYDIGDDGAYAYTMPVTVTFLSEGAELDFDHPEERYHGFWYGQFEYNGWTVLDEQTGEYIPVSAEDAERLLANDNWFYLSFDAVPSPEDIFYSDYMGQLQEIHFDCPGEMSFDASGAGERLSFISVSHPDASITFTKPTIEGTRFTVEVYSGSITVNGDVYFLLLTGTEESQPNAVVRINGNVNELTWYGKASQLDSNQNGAPYTGDLYVSGAIQNGVQKGNCVIHIDEYVGDIAVNLPVLQFSKAAGGDGLVIEDGELVSALQQTAQSVGDITREDLWLTYNRGFGEEENWWLDVQLDPDLGLGAYASTIDLENFDASKIQSGDSVLVNINDSPSDGTIVLSGNYAEVDINGGSVRLTGSTPALYIWGYSMFSSAVVHPRTEVTIDGQVDFLSIQGIHKGTNVRTGENGSVAHGMWHFYPNGRSEYTSSRWWQTPVGANQPIMIEGSLRFLTVDGNGEYGSIVAQMDELAEAAGVSGGDSFAAMEIRNGNVQLNDEERALVEKAAPGAEVVTQFDVQVTAYTVDENGGMLSTSNLVVLESEATFYLQMPTNDPTASYEVVRIHDGVAKVMENAVIDNGQAKVTSSLFSKYVVVKINGSLVTVTFDSVGGTAVDPVQVSVGETLTAPEAPTKNGWAFAGWYTSDDDGTTLSEQPFDFTAPIADNYTLYAKWAKCSITTTLTLRDNINFNVLIYNFIESDFDNWTVEAVFDGKTKEYPLTEDMLTSNGYYKVCVATAASRQIADEITLSFWYNRVLDIDGNVVNEGTLRGVMTSSVKKFCEDRIAENSDVKLKALCEATLEYGAMAQKYFNHNTDNLANSRIAELDHGYVSPVADTVIDKTQYKLYNEGRLSCFKGFQGSLVLKSEITLKFNFKLDLSGSEEVTFYYNDAVIEPSTNGEYTVISIPGIKARELSQWYTVKLVDSTGDEMSITYSPFTFAANNQGTNTLGMLCKALYLYGLAAKSYFGG